VTGWSPARLPERLGDGLIALVGFWSLYAQMCVWLGVSFDQVFLFAWLPALAGLALLASTHADPPPASIDENPSPPPSTVSWVTLGLASAGLVAWQLELIPLLPATLLGLVHLATLIRAGGPAAAPDLRARPADVALCVAAGLLCAGFVLNVHRPGMDDAYYLNAAASALDHPDLAVLSFDGMHGDPSLRIHQVAHRAQTYELLVAVVARALGITAADAYYLVLPPIWAALLPVVLWLGQRVLAPRSAGLGVLVALAVLLLWGGADQTWGNYGLVRIFQGKSVYVALFVPLTVFAAMRFVTQPSWSSWSRLLLAQAAGACFTSTALVMGPICAGLAALAFAPWTANGLRTLAYGACASVPAVLTLIVLRAEAASFPVPSTEEFRYDVRSVLGGGWRGPLVLFGLLVGPALARWRGGPHADAWARYALCTGAVVWTGALGLLLADGISDHFIWRVYWVVPVPLLLGAAASSFVDRPTDAGGVARVGAVVAALTAFGASGITTWDPKNGVHTGFARHKVQPWADRLVDRILAEATPDTVVLAPTRVAGPMVGRQHPPEAGLGPPPVHQQHGGAVGPSERRTPPPSGSTHRG
jgi:hypothetical protein